MTNILGKIAQTLGLDGENRNTTAAEAGDDGATEAGGAASADGLSMGGGGGTPESLRGAADQVAQATGGTDPIRPAQPGGSLAAGGQSTAGTDPITPEERSGEAAPRSHDIGGGSGAV
jgi:hypothetical protein